MSRTIKLMVVLLLTFISVNSFASQEKRARLEKLLPVHGSAWVIDMDKTGSVNQHSLTSGNDSILGKLDLATNNNPIGTHSFTVRAHSVTNAKDLVDLDMNKDGILDAQEIRKSNLVLIMYSKEGNVSIVPMANSHIKKIIYTVNKKDSSKSTNIKALSFVSDKGDEYKGIYYVVK